MSRAQRAMNEKTAPTSIEEFDARLREISGTLPKRLQQCAEFVSANTDRIAVSTVAEIAAAADVQPSALMRFCKILGFKGYSGLQRLFRDAYSQQWPDYSTRLATLRAQSASEPSALLAEFVETGRLALEDLVGNVDPAALDQAVEVLAKARLVHVAGYRRAFPVVSYLSYAFEKMECPSMLHDGTGQLNQRHSISPDDAVIAVSFAPYTAQTVSLVDHANDLGCPVVVLTDTAMSPFDGDNVSVITVKDAEVAGFRSLTSTMSLAMTIAVSVGRMRGS